MLANWLQYIFSPSEGTSESRQGLDAPNEGPESSRQAPSVDYSQSLKTWSGFQSTVYN